VPRPLVPLAYPREPTVTRTHTLHVPQTIFDLVGTPAISSPYQPGGPKAGKDATYGYAKSDGPVLADGYENDVTREKAAFDVSSKIVSSQGPNIDSKTWWLVR
jgi:hypothetical protein